MITTLAKDEVHLEIAGPAGKLEMAVGLAHKPERDGWGIVCHPHPLYGGTMDNKVVTTLTKTFQAMGLSTVRFNFRGVGRSEGHYDAGKGELEDLLAVIAWARKEKLKREIWLAGFSFGAYIATKAATEYPITRLVTIAPPVTHFHMALLPPITCPWILVQGEQDDVVPAEEVYAWVRQRDPQPEVIKFPTAGHFFHGQLGELRETLLEALRR